MQQNAASPVRPLNRLPARRTAAKCCTTEDPCIVGLTYAHNAPRAGPRPPSSQERVGFRSRSALASACARSSTCAAVPVEHSPCDRGARSERSRSATVPTNSKRSTTRFATGLRNVPTARTKAWCTIRTRATAWRMNLCASSLFYALSQWSQTPRLFSGGPRHHIPDRCARRSRTPRVPVSARRHGAQHARHLR
jgi:hypothetical protein